MKKQTFIYPFVFLLVFCCSMLIPSTSYGQFCCCPACPECLVDAGGCGFTCAVNSFCNDASFAESSADAACLGTACNALPVELIYFKTTNSTSGGVQIAWGTASEVQNRGFNIQRMSGLDMEWEVIEFVSGHGTTSEAKDYFFEDKTAPPGNNYYRLKQFDYDGNISISDIEVAKVYEEEAFQLFPTVAKDYIFINSTDHSHVDNKVEIFTLVGQQVMAGIFDYASGGNIDISSLPTGQYMVQITPLNGQPQILRFVKAE